MIKAGVVGATGYAGQELVRLLLQHPQVELKTVVSQSHAGKPYSTVYPGFKNHFDAECSKENLPELATQLDVIFFALPHGEAAKKINEQLLQQVRVIDLGSDFRLKEPSAYDTWYGMKHSHPQLLKSAIYGLSELHRKEIKQARLIANPGCYATGSILALTPLLKHDLVEKTSLVIDAKSGVSGAGRSLLLDTHFNEVNGNIKAYKVASHRHTPEIEQELSWAAGATVILSFTPHLVPMNRGILITAYAVLKKGVDGAAAWKVYREEYGTEPFIRLYESENDDCKFPETRWVKCSNFCDIGLCVDKRTRRIIVVAALDNLIKGAAGQAIQNMNLAFGLEETTGLKQLPIFPA